MGRQYGALSGVAILLIVLNHAVHFTLQVSVVEEPGRQILILLQALGTYAVPVFLFISGAFLAYAASEFSFALIRANLERILWPYLIWSSVFYAVLFVTSDVRYPLSGYLKNVVVGYPYHFVPLLVFWYLAAPLAARIARRHGVALLVGIGLYQLWLIANRYPAAIGVEGLLPSWTGWTTPPVLFGPMADWAIYFPLGLVLALHAATAKRVLMRARGAAALACGVLFALGLLNAFGVLPAAWARLAAPLPLMLLLPLVDRGWIPYPRQFELLGRRSYAIYLVHFIFINLGVFAVTQMAGGQSGAASIVVLPVLLVLALAGPLVLMDLVSRAGVARPAYRYIFGTVPTRRVPAARDYVSSGVSG